MRIRLLVVHRGSVSVEIYTEIPTGLEKEYRPASGGNVRYDQLELPRERFGFALR